MKPGMVITQSGPETVYDTLRLALYSLKQGYEVQIFLSGKGVEKSGGSDICPLSTLKDHYEIVRDSDRLVTI